MSSKNIESSTDFGLRHASKRWSLTVRLALLYALASVAMLLLLSVALFWVLTESIEADELQALTRDIAEVKALLQAPGRNRTLLTTEVVGQSGAPGVGSHTTRYMRIQDGAGQVRFETPGMAGRLPSGVFELAEMSPGVGVHWRSDDKPYLLMSATTAAAAGHWHIQAAMDLSKEAELIGNYRRKMSALLLLGIVLVTAISALLTYHGLRPLRDIAAVARRISATQLHERVEAARWPRELADLAGAFDQMLQRLEASFGQLQQFSADLAHELRTPVNALMGEAEVTLARARTADEYREALESALEQYRRLARLIDNLLFLARAEDPQAVVERKVLDIRHEFEAVCDFYDALIGEKNIHLHCEAQGTLAADPILFRRALSNLLSNALRHTAAGGQVGLTVRHAGSEGVEICVSDSGEGIAADQIPRLFERLYRVDGSRRQHDGGAGLGLSIVKSIMTLHGGSVTLQSTPGEGTAVTLRFPPPPAPVTA